MVTTVKCPKCETLSNWESNPHRPFCSERCKSLDLGGWATEAYRIPAEENNSSDSDDDSNDEDGN